MARQRKDRARGSAAGQDSHSLTVGARSRLVQATGARARQCTLGDVLKRRLRCETLEDRRLRAVITVTTVEDSVDFDDGVTSLREAIFAANTVPGADEIRFDPGLFAAGAQTILLTHGELAITESLTITGPGADVLTIDASGSDPTPDVNNGDGSRIFLINDGRDDVVVETIVSGLTFTGGDASGVGGGAILARANLAILNCVFDGNATGNNGGAIATMPGVSGQLTIDATTIADNVAVWFGGGVYWQGPFAIAASRLSGNQAIRGGAAYLWSTRESGDAIANTVIVENEASLGAGVYWRGGNLNISNATISQNTAVSAPGFPSVLGRGGGLRLRGQLATIANSTISGNQAGTGGGVYALQANFTVRDSTISENSATALGGGIRGGVAVEILDSKVQNNRAGRSGGGVTGGLVTVRRSLIDGNTAGTLDAPRPSESYFAAGGIRAGAVVVDSSTISRNFAADRGGGISISGGLADSTITNSTISGNAANEGGGVFHAPTHLLWIEHSTITENEAVTNRGEPGRGGGLAEALRGSDSMLRVRNSIVAGNATSGTGPDIVAGPGGFYRFNLIGDASGPAALTEAPVGSPDANGNLVGGPAHGVIDPQLGPLADNGGPTLTHALLPGSPAIDAGDAALRPGVVGVPEFDQRGEPLARVVGARIDIGAVEQTGVPFVVDTLIDESDGDYSRGDLSLREAIELANAQPGVGEIVFHPALFAAGPTKIRILSGELVVAESLVIRGPGQDVLTLDAEVQSRILHYTSSRGDLALSGLRFFRGYVVGASQPPLGTDFAGGAIRFASSNTLTLDNVVVQDSAAINDYAKGGGVYAAGIARVENYSLATGRKDIDLREVRSMQLA